MTPLRTLVAHPGATSLLYPLVASLQEIDKATEFHTGLYFDLDGIWARILAQLPAAMADPLRREMTRRYRPGISAATIRRHRLAEIIYILARRGGVNWGNATMHWRNEGFDLAVARAIRRGKPRNFIGFDGSSKHSIAAARDQGIRSILVQAIGHIDELNQIMERERRKWPAFFASDPPSVDSPWLVRQRIEAKTADIVAVPSDYVADTLIKHGTQPDRVRKIRYPCDLVRFPFEPNRPAQPWLRALFVGAIGARKGVPYLLEAVAPLVRAGAMTLDLVGSLDCPAAALAPWRDVFRHRSGLAPDQMAAVYRQADVFVFPSLHEGQAMACNEALASGLPLICTPNAGTEIVNGVEGFLVPIRDSAAIAACLQMLIDDRTMLQPMSLAARAHAEANDVIRFRSEVRALLAP